MWMTVIQYQIAFTKQAAQPPTQNSSYPQERKEVTLKPRHTRGPTEKEPSCSNSMLRCYNLKLSEAPFFPSSLEATYICNMIWFKKMPSARSMYMVRLSWLPLPKEPKVFTCRVGERERQEKSPRNALAKALQGKGRQSLCGKSGSPMPARPPISRASTSTPRQETEKLPPCSPVSQGEKQQQKQQNQKGLFNKFLTSQIYWK